MLRSEDANEWDFALRKEYALLMANGTWELTMLPKGCKNVGCKWVFCTKKNASGEIVKYKAWLVAKDYSQVAGMALEIHQMDIKTVFLNGILKVEIYMDQLEGFVQENKEDLVCKLKKTLYELKQSQGHDTTVWTHLRWFLS
jgi:hypothetical protein